MPQIHNQQRPSIDSYWELIMLQTTFVSLFPLLTLNAPPLQLHWYGRPSSFCPPRKLSTATVKRDPLLFVETPGALDLHRTVDTSSGRRSPSDGRCKWIKTDKDWTAYLIDIGRPTWFPSNGGESSWKNSMIAARSNRDRGSFSVESERRFSELIGRRSLEHQYHDRRPIVARSWRKSWLFRSKIKAKFTTKLERNWSHNIAARNRFHDAINQPSRPLQLPTILGPISPLKSHVFSLCSSTFDRFVKELSKFRGRSLVHRDPPAFRLDCEAIGAGLIANFSLISSNFPLEFRTSARKNPSKFASIHENWSPIIAETELVVRFDRLSVGNLSFY